MPQQSEQRDDPNGIELHEGLAASAEEMAAAVSGTSALAGMGASVPDAAAAAAAYSSMLEGMSPEQQAVQNAIFQAQYAQCLQQLQFSEQNRSLGLLAVTPPRFTGDCRPVKPCIQIMSNGFCKRGEACTFAHTFEELHPAVAEDLSKRAGLGSTNALAEMSASAAPPAKAAMRMREKREMCRAWHRQECLLGSLCPDAHTKEELYTTARVYDVSVRRGLCKHWLKGECIFGQGCMNAHGEDQIGTPKPDKIVTPGTRKREEEKAKSEGSEMPPWLHKKPRFESYDQQAERWKSYAVE